MSRPDPFAVRRPPYDVSLSFRVNDEAIIRIARHVDIKMGWSGRPVSPAARELTEYILGLIEAKARGEARRRQA